MSDKASDRRGTERRGTWQGSYTALFDDPDFLRLSATARHVLLTLRHGPQVNAICIFPFVMETLARYTGLRRRALENALRELERTPNRKQPWLFRGDGLVWIRNGLRFNPSVERNNPKHWPWINRLVEGLPRVPLVRKFKEVYGLPWDRQSGKQDDSQDDRQDDRVGEYNTTPDYTSLNNTSQQREAPPPPPPHLGEAPAASDGRPRPSTAFDPEKHNGNCTEGLMGKCFKRDGPKCYAHERVRAMAGEA